MVRRARIAVPVVAASLSLASYAQFAIELEPGPGRQRAGPGYATLEQALARLSLDCHMYPDMRATVVDTRTGQRTLVQCVLVHEGGEEWKAVPADRPAPPPGRYRVAEQQGDGEWREAGSYLTATAAREATERRCAGAEGEQRLGARMTDSETGVVWEIDCAAQRSAWEARGVQP